MTFNSKTLLFGLLIIALSCNSQNNQREKLLEDSKVQIRSTLDSINIIFDLALQDHRQGVSEEVIISTYRSEMGKLRSQMNSLLERPTKDLEGDQRLSQVEYNAWMSQFDLSQIQAKAKHLEDLGIDFNKVSVINKYDLNQVYSDTSKGITIRFPETFSVAPDYDQQAFMAAGHLGLDSANQGNNRVAIGLGISPVSQSMTTNQYFQSNLSHLKTTEGLKIIEKAKVDFNGTIGEYVAVSFPTQGTEIASTQIFLVENNRGYILTGTVVSKDFENFRQLFLEVAQTLKIK